MPPDHGEQIQDCVQPIPGAADLEDPLVDPSKEVIGSVVVTPFGVACRCRLVVVSHWMRDILQ